MLIQVAQYTCVSLQDSVDTSRGRGKDQSPRKDPRKGSDQRQKSGARERNLGHKNGEEHSRVPKGNGMPIRRMVAIGSVAVLSVAIIVLAADDVTGVGDFIWKKFLL